jgi:hypothetical protein
MVTFRPERNGCMARPAFSRHRAFPVKSEKAEGSRPDEGEM